MKWYLILILIVLLSISVSAVSLSRNYPISSSPLGVLPTSLTNGLVAYWSFDVDGRDDFDGDDNATYDGVTRTGLGIGGSAFFDRNDKATIISPRMRRNDDFSIVGWYRRDLSSSRNFTLFTARSTSVDYPINFKIFWSTDYDTLIAFVTCNSSIGSGVLGSGTFNGFEWHHIGFVYDKDLALSLYYDGREIDRRPSYTGNCDISPPQQYAHFGWDPRGGEYLTGFLDEWRFYNRTLNSSEIYYLANPNSTRMQPICGDVTQDGRIDILDALLIAKYTSGLQTLMPNQIYCADVNYLSAYIVDILDALLIARKTVGYPINLSCGPLC